MFSFLRIGTCSRFFHLRMFLSANRHHFAGTCASVHANEDRHPMTSENPSHPKPREVMIRVHDGVEIALALYVPDGEGPFPTVFGASPYRYDNNTLPASPQFLCPETGPIAFYFPPASASATTTGPASA